MIKSSTDVIFHILAIVIPTVLLVPVESFTTVSSPKCELESSCPCQSAPSTFVRPPKTLADSTLFVQNAARRAYQKKPLISSKATRVSSFEYYSPSSLRLTKTPTLTMDRFVSILQRKDTNSSPSLSFDEFQQRFEKDTQNSESIQQKSPNRNIGYYTCTFSWTIGLSVVALLSVGTIATISPNLLPFTAATVTATTTAIQEFVPNSFLPNVPITAAFIKQTFSQQIVPSALAALKQMVVFEFWRQIWLWTFRSLGSLYKTVFGVPFSKSIWRRYIPTFIRMGIRKLSIRVLEKKLKGYFGDLWSWGYDMLYLGSEDDLDLTEDLSNNNLMGDGISADDVLIPAIQ